jgi:hypothetical protein
MQIIARRNRETHAFHPITANCCGITAEVLNEAEIISLETKTHMAFMWYGLILPKWTRRFIDTLGKLVDKISPQCLSTAFAKKQRFSLFFNFCSHFYPFSGDGEVKFLMKMKRKGG